MPHVLVVGHIRNEGLAILHARPEVTVEVLAEPTLAQTIDAAGQAEAILVRTAPIPRAVIEAAPRLRVVSRHGVGYDNVDLAACNARGIPIAIAATANMVAVAEQAFFMLMELAKQGRQHDAAVREGRWAFRNRQAAIELAGKRLLIMGLGRIGRELVRRCRAFDMVVAGFDPHISPEAMRAMGIEPETALLPALARADAVSLHLPLTPATRGIVGRDQLRAMKPSAILVNTARGGLIDETALEEALRKGWIRGAGLDVFSEEPPRAGSPLFAFENLILSPHSAGVTVEAAIRMAKESATNLLAALDGRLDPSLVVNPQVLAGR